MDNEQEALTLWQFAREELSRDEHISERVLSGVTVLLCSEQAWDSSTLLENYSVAVEYGGWRKEIEDVNDIAAACTHLAGISTKKAEEGVPL